MTSGFDCPVGNKGEVYFNGNLVFRHHQIEEDAYILTASVELQEHNVITLDFHGNKDASVLVEVFPVDAEALVVTVEEYLRITYPRNSLGATRVIWLLPEPWPHSPGCFLASDF